MALKPEDRYTYAPGDPAASQNGRKGRRASYWNVCPAVDTEAAADAQRAHLANPRKAHRLAALRAASIKIDERNNG